MSKLIIQSLFFAGFFMVVVPASANEVEPIYGSQLMTQQERLEHQAQMRAAKTPGEKQRLRQLHHQKMQLRAKQKGIVLPDQPPAKPGYKNQLNRPGMGKMQN
ncbi:hypothetical protein [Thiomicrorhabdus sp.]|uniref:hypothetical protein n=1 Tax=Thiomicrorhabdus sp. TaxID=2039724 RepID=UPI002AA67D7F|nr:hypothetical protein [Thiomicrorhabdus sp.]